MCGAGGTPPPSPLCLGAVMRVQPFKGLSAPKDDAKGLAATAQELDAALSQARDFGHKVEIGVEEGQVIVFVDGKSIGYTKLDDDLMRVVFAPYLL